jgi:hypothetical protein
MEKALVKLVALFSQYSRNTVVRLTYTAFEKDILSKLPPGVVPEEEEARDAFWAALHPETPILAPRTIFPTEQHNRSGIWLAVRQEYIAAEKCLASTTAFAAATLLLLEPTGPEAMARLDALDWMLAEQTVGRGYGRCAIVLYTDPMGSRAERIRALIAQLLVERHGQSVNEAAVNVRRVCFIGRRLIATLRAPYPTTIIIDHAHLYGSLDHAAWVSFIKQFKAPLVPPDCVLIGWRGIPAVLPGYCLSPLDGLGTAMDSVRFIARLYWERTGFLGRDNAGALPKLIEELTVVQGSALPVLQLIGRGGMQSSECKYALPKRQRALGAVYTEIVPLQVLPEFMVNRTSRFPAMLVLFDTVAEALSLEDWLLLLVTARGAVLLFVYEDGADTNPELQGTFVRNADSWLMVLLNLHEEKKRWHWKPQLTTDVA